MKNSSAALDAPLDRPPIHRESADLKIGENHDQYENHSAAPNGNLNLRM